MISSRARAVALLFALLFVACADLERGATSAPAPPRDAAANDVAVGGDAATDANAISFVRDVHPLIVAACASCHSAGGEAGRTALLLVAEPAADRAQLLAFVDTTAPADSRLLAKSAGSGHGGGAVLPTGSPEYQTILRWISEGSLP